ncbi:alpha-lytic protease prodomain-containing protein [Allosalinactinospora lopnorensis]|uniref:alpha-lytic protease prodomain-containing protein n=1 Tax=Allosalinactinospora lopnorensis TaxID=1352348 RepID=UPI0030840710
MRKSSLTTSLGAAVAATGLLTVAPGTAAASTEPTAGPFEQALQRDLGLPADEVPRLLEQEQHARDQERRIRDTIGGAFGGAVFDIETRQLTVLVTDPSAVTAVEEAGARARVVQYGEDALDDMVAALNAEASSADPNVQGWYTDIDADTVVVSVHNGASEAAEGLVADAGVEADAVRVTEGAAAPRVFAPIIGGNGYIIDGAGQCSVGFSAESDDESGFVTAGHCGSAGTPVEGVDGGNGTVAGSTFPGRDTDGSSPTTTGPRRPMSTTTTAARWPSPGARRPRSAPPSAGPEPPPAGAAAPSRRRTRP